MKILKTLVRSSFLVFSIILISNLFSCQDLKPEDRVQRCGTMIGYDDRIKTDSVFVANETRLEEEINEYIKRMRTGEFTEFRSGKVIIPVVVHVVYSNTTENISDAQIQSQIDVLNEDYRRLNADVSGVPSEFNSLVADARIEFKLAQRDPDCNPTNGITRTSTTSAPFNFNPSATTATARNPVKFNSSGGRNAWPSDEYLNFWVCDLAGGLLGYGSFPSDFASRPAEDGVVMDFESFGNMGTASPPFDLGRTTTHEIGHWLNLRHIWGDDCPSASQCSGSDFVNDTPNQECSNLGCPSHPQNTCSSNDMFMNYMDYVDDNCMIMFSNGQSDRMDAVLYTTRTGIVSSQADLPPPGVAQDMYSKDMANDLGDEPNTISARMYRSDDIWVRNTNDGITNQEHQNAIGNAINYVYVRVRNRGCGTAASGDVKLYWAKASSGLSWPSPWDGSVVVPATMGGFIGQQPTGSISASGFTILEYAWTAPNPADYSSFGADKTHFCLLSRIETSATAPFGMTFPETANLGDNVRNNNNIVWKNISISEPASGGGRFASTMISNFTKEPKKYKIVFQSAEDELPIFKYGRLIVTLNKSLYKIWESNGKQGEGIEFGKDKNEILILKDGAYLEGIYLNKNQFFVATVTFYPKQQQSSYNRKIFKLDLIQNEAGTNQFVGAQSFIFRLGN